MKRVKRLDQPSNLPFSRGKECHLITRKKKPPIPKVKDSKFCVIQGTNTMVWTVPRPHNTRYPVKESCSTIPCKQSLKAEKKRKHLLRQKKRANTSGTTYFNETHIPASGSKIKQSSYNTHKKKIFRLFQYIFLYVNKPNCKLKSVSIHLIK